MRDVERIGFLGLVKRDIMVLAEIGPVSWLASVWNLSRASEQGRTRWRTLRAQLQKG